MPPTSSCASGGCARGCGPGSSCGACSDPAPAGLHDQRHGGVVRRAGGTTASIRCGPGSASARRELRGQFRGRAWRGSRARPSRSARAVKSRPGLDRSSRLRAASPVADRADPVQLHAEDGVRPVAEDDRRDVELLPGVRPQRRDRVHGAAVGLQREHAAARAGDRRAGGQRQALADRAAGQREPVVRRCAGGGSRQPQARGVRLVGHDRPLGQQRADDRRRALGGQVAVRAAPGAPAAGRRA